MRRYLQGVLLFCGIFTLIAQAQFSICDTPGLDVPQAECQALMSIYANTGGINWTYGIDWGSSTTICSWEGVVCSGGHVTELNMWDSNIQGGFAITEGNLDFLEYLYLYSNQITGFSTAGLSRLIVLELGWNQLVSFDGAGLTNLQTLKLNDNNLTLFNGAGLTNLINLYLYDSNPYDSYDNKLSSFNGSLFPNLQTLDIRGNQLASFDGSQLADLVSLDIRNNTLTTFSGAGLIHLDTLYASDNKISSITNQDQLTSIWYVSVSGNKLTSPTPAVSAWLDQYAESNWSQTQTTTTNPSGSTGSTGGTNCSNGYLCDNSNPSSTTDSSSTTEPPSITNPPTDTDPSTTTEDAECAATHFGCTRGGSEQQVTGNLEWTWKCYVPGNPDGMVSCSEKRPGECGQNKNTCNRGNLIDHPDTATEYKWECYVGGTNPAWCSKPIPDCGATKFSCSGGTLGVQSTLPSVYTWTCTNGEESVACQLDRPMCSSPLVKNTCLQGAPQNFITIPGVGPFQNRITGQNNYIWECALNGETKSCSVIVDLCGAVEMQPGQECCNNTIIDPATQYCCDHDKVENNEDNGVTDHANSFFGPSELICDKQSQPTCFYQRKCSNGNNEKSGEKGSPDPNNSNFAECNYKLACHVAIMHECRTDRPNNNCQDECLPRNDGTLPDPVLNCGGGGGIVGSCGGVYPTCATGFVFGANGVSWWCLGDNPDSQADDVVCSRTGTGVCGATYGTCSTGTPQIIDATHWKCLGSFSSQTWDDVSCNLNPVNGSCGNIYGSCAEGTPQVIDATHWNCLGKNGGTNAPCKINACSTIAPTANSTVCNDGPVPATDNASGSLVAACSSSVQCDWICTAGFYKNGAVCTPYVCQGTTPANATLCIGDDIGLTVNTTRSLVNICSATKCEYTCNNGFYNNAGVCTPYVCQGTTPANATLCPGSDTGLTVNTTRSLVSICSTTKCAYTCSTGYTLIAGVCQANALPTIDSPTATAITGSSATLGARVTSVGIPSPLLRRGVCWSSTTTNPTLNPSTGGGGEAGTNCQADGGTTTGIFTINATSLVAGTLYHYRGYAQNATGTAYTADTVFTTSGPSGTLTALPNPCTIAVGASTCTTSLTWTTANLTANPTAVTTPGRANISAATSGTATNIVVEYVGRNFFLYHNAVQLATVNVTAVCIAGSTWNGTICQANVVPTVISPTATSITASSAVLGANVASLGMPASISARGTCWGTTPNPLTNCVPHGTFTTGIFSHSRTGLSPGTTYYYRGYATNATGTGYSPDATFTTPISVTLTASPSGPLVEPGSTTLTWTTTGNPTSCVASNYWDGAKVPTGGSEMRTGMTEQTYNFIITCYKAGTADVSASVNVVILPAPDGLLTASDCTIPKGQSSCNIKLNWTTTNLILGKDTAVTTPTSASNPTPLTVSTLTNGTDVSYVVPFGSRNFFLYHNTVELDSATATATCEIGTEWNGTICQTNTTPDGLLTASDCTIPKGQSSCNTKLNWTTTNLISGKDTAVTTPTSASNPTPLTVSTLTNGTDVSYVVPFGSRNFFLYHNAVELDSATATATCELTTGWDTDKSKCEKYRITYDKNGGTGSVPEDLTEYLPQGNALILGQGSLSKTGSTFGGWKNLGASVDYNVGDTMTVDSDTTLYAHWESNTYSLKIEKSGTPGTIRTIDLSIDCGTICEAQYTPTSTVQLQSILGPGSSTIRWGGDCDTSGQVTMNADKTCTAVFTGPLVGCFADSSTGKDLTNYQGNLLPGPGAIYGLLKRVLDGPSKMGYMLTDSDRESQTRTFRTKLAGNINKYITSRYCPSSNFENEWNADSRETAIIDPILSDCDDITKAINHNKSGYFYYQGNGQVLTVSGLGNTNPDPSVTSDSITQPTVLYVVGADIYIKENIKYSTSSGDSPSLVIIAQKDGNNGGNIYVDPAVTHIDGTLIADGALMNYDITTVPQRRNWIAHPLTNRLVINGRLLTYNLRGGSLKTDLEPIGSGAYTEDDDGNCADGSKAPVKCESGLAASQDLERFRWIEPDGDNTCSLYVTNNLPTRRPDILTTVLD